MSPMCSYPRASVLVSQPSESRTLKEEFHGRKDKTEYSWFIHAHWLLGKLPSKPSLDSYWLVVALPFQSTFLNSTSSSSILKPEFMLASPELLTELKTIWRRWACVASGFPQMTLACTQGGHDSSRRTGFFLRLQGRLLFITTATVVLAQLCSLSR